VFRYYERVAPTMLPHVRGRPLNGERYRGPIGEVRGFFQQDFPHLPDWMGSVTVGKRGGGTVTHPVVEDADGIAYLANQGVVTMHAWSSRVPDVEVPDEVIFDLDPADDDFETVRFAALELRAVLEGRGVVSAPMTSGSRGLHIVVPLDGSATFDDAKAFATDVRQELVARAPDRLTGAFYKSQRRGRLYVDIGRTARGHTAVVPYTVRARPGAPVATPLDWDEVGDRRLHAQRWTIKTLFRRLGRREDPWAQLWSQRQPLPAGA
jgi:bifunctional non-homologous end joining protein LigD